MQIVSYCTSYLFFDRVILAQIKDGNKEQFCDLIAININFCFNNKNFVLINCKNEFNVWGRKQQSFNNVSY